MKASIFSFLSVAVLSLGLSTPAGAATVTLGGPAPGSVASTFAAGNTASPGSWSFGAGAATANSSSANNYLDPLITSQYYAYASDGATITASFAGGITSFDMLWGSPDASNSITLSGPGGSVTYTAVQAGLTPGDVNADSAMVLFTATPGTDWTTVSFNTGVNSFEIAQVSTLAAPSPEPASIALLTGGLLAIGVGAVRRRKAS